MTKYEEQKLRQKERYRGDEAYRERVRRYSRRRGWSKMGFDPNTAETEFERLHALQNGLCAICEKPESVLPRGNEQKLALDHCPDTMQIRGLLCIKCNRGIGNFDDDPDVLKRAVEYLKK